MTTTDIATRFATDTADHQMTILHDEGLYRHVRFAPQGKGSYWFGLITSPGTLVFQGDIGASYVFNRLPDMFDLFRKCGHRLDVSYLAEKVTSGRDGITSYDPEKYRRQVTDHLADAIVYRDVPEGTDVAVAQQLLDPHIVESEVRARDALNEFNHEGFTFGDACWEWDLKSYEWRFEWTCHAIAWGVTQYDTARTLTPTA